MKMAAESLLQPLPGVLGNINGGISDIPNSSVKRLIHLFKKIKTPQGPHSSLKASLQPFFYLV
ncbi:hypothetical protein JI667_02575 [Bacillus sp. NTK074B]|uniref:hypothetical protein n=1 Tax=Bacillus sp. NTK074B TaxID=2802174 RepID=UPI001A903638|nr:hypothetical protein [Bacillus sp. NTK074B]